MKVKMNGSHRYADPAGPHLPIIDFIDGTVVDVDAKLAESIISNGHGETVLDDVSETAVVEPESKDDGVVVESKDAAPTDEVSAYDNLSPKKQSFVDEYMVDSEGTQAAIRAGYAENSAEMRAVALLAEADVQAAIAEKSPQ